MTYNIFELTGCKCLLEITEADKVGVDININAEAIARRIDFYNLGSKKYQPSESCCSKGCLYYLIAYY